MQTSSGHKLLSGIRNAAAAAMQPKNTDLDQALTAEKRATEALDKYLVAQKDAATAWQKYAISEPCVTIQDTIMRLGEIHEIWEKAMQDYIGQRIEYRKVFKEVIDGERQLDEARKQNDMLAEKIASLKKRKAAMKLEDKAFQTFASELEKAQAQQRAQLSTFANQTENHFKFKHNRVLTSTSVLKTCEREFYNVCIQLIDVQQKIVEVYAQFHYSRLSQDDVNKSRLTCAKIVNDLRQKHRLSSFVIPADGVNFTVSAIPGEVGGHEMVYSGDYIGIPASESASDGSDYGFSRGDFVIPPSAPVYETRQIAFPAGDSSREPVTTNGNNNTAREPVANGNSSVIREQAPNGNRDVIRELATRAANTSREQGNNIVRGHVNNNSKAQVNSVLLGAQLTRKPAPLPRPERPRSDNTYLALEDNTPLPDYNSAGSQGQGQVSRGPTLVTRANSIYETTDAAEPVHMSLATLQRNNSSMTSVPGGEVSRSGSEKSSNSGDWSFSSDEGNVYNNTVVPSSQNNKPQPGDTSYKSTEIPRKLSAPADSSNPTYGTVYPGAAQSSLYPELPVYSVPPPSVYNVPSPSVYNVPPPPRDVEPIKPPLPPKRPVPKK